MRVDIRKCRQGIPSSVPDDLFPSLNLYTLLYLEDCPALPQKPSERLKPSLLKLNVKGGVGEEAYLHILGFRMRDHAWRGLRGAYPCHAAEDCVVGKGVAEGFFVAYAVLDYHEGCGVADAGFEEKGDAGGVDGFVGADDVVEFLGRI